MPEIESYIERKSMLYKTGVEYATTERILCKAALTAVSIRAMPSFKKRSYHRMKNAEQKWNPGLLHMQTDWQRYMHCMMQAAKHG